MIHGLISAIAFTLFFLLVRIAGPVYFSQVAYLVTFFGIAIAMVVFDERYSAWHWAAFAVTVAGVILVNRTQTQGAHAAHKS
jgi:drug/metabolite transporter (DMT)-like permease